jgi:hypothetical protein
VNNVQIDESRFKKWSFRSWNKVERKMKGERDDFLVVISSLDTLQDYV